MEYEDLVMEIKKEEEYQELVMGPKIFDLKKKLIPPHSLTNFEDDTEVLPE